MLTGQLFFPDEVSRQVYASISPYDRRPVDSATFNDRDGIARRAGAVAISEVMSAGGALEAALVVAVDPNA
jgi:hypothetical protein